MLELALAPTAGTSVAQARDHNHGIHEVAGSIPASSTNFPDDSANGGLSRLPELREGPRPSARADSGHHS